jgi:hypothetical protein
LLVQEQVPQVVAEQVAPVNQMDQVELVRVMVDLVSKFQQLLETLLQQ